MDIIFKGIFRQEKERERETYLGVVVHIQDPTEKDEASMGFIVKDQNRFPRMKEGRKEEKKRKERRKIKIKKKKRKQPMGI